MHHTGIELTAPSGLVTLALILDYTPVFLEWIGVAVACNPPVRDLERAAVSDIDQGGKSGRVRGMAPLTARPGGEVLQMA